jgi:hypothetical protein
MFLVAALAPAVHEQAARDEDEQQHEQHDGLGGTRHEGGGLNDGQRLALISVRNSQLPMTFQRPMARKLIICTAVAALTLAGPASAASPLDEYQQTGHITPCRYSSNQLQGSVPNDVAQYAPEYASQLQAAARERASGCGGSGGGGATGRGAAAGGPGSSSASSGSAGPGTAAGVAAATARKIRVRARARRRARARARLAAATVVPGDLSADARVPDRALLLAGLPILLLLALVAALRTWETVGRRARLARGPARTPTGAIILPPAGNGNGNGTRGNGAAEAAAADAPTEEAAALYPPATSRRRKTRYAAKSDGTA